MICSSRRIVLSTLGSLGDLHPLMALALGLKARGHRITLVTSEFYRDRIESLGLTFRALRPLQPPHDAQMLRRVLDSRTGPEFLIRTLLLPHLRDMYDDMMRATEGADFLISGEVVLAAPLVAEKRRLPWAAAVLAPFSFFSAYDPSALPILPFAQRVTRAAPFIQRALLGAIRLATRHWARPIHELRRELELRPTAHPLMWDRFSPLLNLALFSNVLGNPQPDWPANTTQCGFLLYDGDTSVANSQLESFLASGPPPITFTLGSTAVVNAGRFYEESVAAARRAGRRALLLVGKNPAPARSSGEFLAIEYAPYSQVFARSACVVHQGGVGTTAQALRAGVPQLVMPYAFDQPDNAARVLRLGVGLNVNRRHYRAPRVAKLLDTLLTEASYAAAAREIAVQVSTDIGLTLACEAIEQAILAGAPLDGKVTRPGEPASSPSP